MMSQFYESLFDTRLSSGREALSDYQTSEGGGQLSTSVSGGFTGRGGDIVIVDDPLKADDALSDRRRDDVNVWYDNTLRNRLNSLETGAIIIVMRRLHAEDTWLPMSNKTELGTCYHLPPLQSTTNTTNSQHRSAEGKPTGRREKPLHPARLSLEQLEAQRRGMTEYNFAAQYGQNPQPQSGR